MLHSQSEADSKKKEGKKSEEKGNPAGSIHEEAFRNDIDEHIGIRIQNPQIIGKEDMVK